MIKKFLILLFLKSENKEIIKKYKKLLFVMLMKVFGIVKKSKIDASVLTLSEDVKRPKKITTQLIENKPYIKGRIQYSLMLSKGMIL